MKKKILMSAATASALLLFSGCMKDGLNGNTSETTATGVDGYIVGATVTDANGNKAFKNGDGTYSFVKAPRYPLTLKGGKLLDTNETFTGTLTAAKGLVISPITTLITKLDANGKPTNEIDTTRLEKLASIAGVSSTVLTGDYMASANIEVAKLAQLANVMNQDKDLLTEFKEQMDLPTVASSGGYSTLLDVAKAATSKLAKTGALSEIKHTVYDMILDDVEDETTTVGIEASLKGTKVMLSNINAIEALGGDIGTDVDSLKTASVLVGIAGNKNSTENLTAEQLSTLGANDTVTNTPALVTMMNDIIKNHDPKIDSKGELVATADQLKNLYLLDAQQDISTNKYVDVTTAVNALVSNVDIKPYQQVELANKITKNSTLEVDTYAKLVDLIDGLTTIDKPVIAVTVKPDLKELVQGKGVKAGDVVATVTATFDDANKSVLNEYTLGDSGDSAKFDINSSTGVITTKKDFDFETTPRYVIDVQVSSKLAGDPKGDGIPVLVNSASQIVSIDVQDVSDFGIAKITYDNKNDTNVSNDTLNIIFNAYVDESTLAPSKFKIGGTGDMSDSATGKYIKATKTYSITGFDTAMVVSVDANESNITMDNSVHQDGLTDEPLVTTASLGLLMFNGLEYGLMRDVNGSVWLDRNLGATKVAEKLKDADAYGDLYQWGRLADGHEKRINPSTQSVSNLATNINASNIDKTMFIKNDSSSPYDWVDNDVDNNGSLRQQRMQ